MNNATVPQNPEWLSTINEALQKNVQDVLAGKINNVTARCNLKKAIIAAGYHPGTAHIEPNSPEDLLCESRLNLVIETNVQMTQGHRNWIESQRVGVLESFPSDELFRLESREKKCDWLSRWRLAGDRTGDPIGTGWTITPDERMIALKNHAIWNWIGSSELFDDALNAIWPPFAFNSGMWVVSISRRECEEIGLITSTDVINCHEALPPSQLIPIESGRITAYFWNEPVMCDHCGEEKTRKVISFCVECGETICLACKAKGCSCPEPEPPPNDAMQCFNMAVDKMMGQEVPLAKDLAEQVLQWCDRAFEFGFATYLRYFEARANRMRGEALESLGQKERALREYELAMEKDPQVGLKKRIISLQKELAKS